VTAPQFDADTLLDDELEDMADGSPAPTGIEALLRSEPQQALWRFGRALKRLHARDQEFATYLTTIRREVEYERERIAKQMRALDDLIEGELLRRREQDPAVKSIDIPGVGRWQSRTVPASWRTVDEAAAIASLAETPDEFARFTEEQTRRVLLKDDLKAWLVETGLAAFPGMERTEAHVTTKGPFQ
jgi:hypothetical protein